MNPLAEGTKCAAWSRVTVPAGGVVSLRFRLCPAAKPDERDPAAFDAVMARRLAEADAFYGALQRDIADPDARLVQRQAPRRHAVVEAVLPFRRPALAYRRSGPAGPAEGRRHGRDSDGPPTISTHADIVSMPDKWEYPWYAAWDLAFHCVTFALIDPAFAKGQLILLTPNGTCTRTAVAGL